VQEAAAAAEGWLRLPEAALNLASVCLAQDQPGPAIQLYTSALRRCAPDRRPRAAPWRRPRARRAGGCVWGHAARAAARYGPAPHRCCPRRDALAQPSITVAVWFEPRGLAPYPATATPCTVCSA